MVEMVAHVDELFDSGSLMTGVAGVMVRASLDQHTQGLASMVGSVPGPALYYKSVPGQNQWVSGGLVNQGPWVRVVRMGNTLKAYSSTNGQDWVLETTEDYPSGTLPGQMYIGMFVTAADRTVLARGKFSEVQIIRY